MIHESREGEGLFPEHIDHVFQVIDRFFAEELLVGKRVSPVSPAALEVLANKRRGELRFSRGHRYSEGKYRIDETVRITDADKAFPAEAAHLVGVIWDNMHLLNQVHFRYAIPKFRVDIVELVPDKLFGSLLSGEKVCVAMASLLPSGKRTETPRTAPSSASSGFVAAPRMTVAPRASASLSIIVSKSLRRTCHVVENERFHSLSRAETGMYQEFWPLVPTTLTPCLTGCSLFIISSSKPSLW